jgi:DAACS family dicarboxylate/amino acid:cation (Na+ or H+) symporter
MINTLLRPLRYWLSMPLWGQILIALALGMATGLIGGHAIEPIQVVGLMFIHAIQMLVVPVVFTAIVCAVMSLDQLTQMRRLVLKALSLYALSMILAATIGVLCAIVIAPGLGMALHLSTAATLVQHVPTASEVLVSFIPISPVAAFVENNVIQILIFAVLLGLSIRLTGEAAKPVEELFKSFSKVVFKFSHIIISFSPYGVFALIAYVFGRYGLIVLLPLVKFIITVYMGCMLQIILVYGGILLANGINPIKFFKAIGQAMILSFTTSSSAATLPVTLKCAQEKLKISKNMSGFLLPLGTTFNLNGLSIYLAVATVFAANLYGIHLGLTQYCTIVITIVFTAMGAAAVPGSALIVMGAVMGSVGIPLGALPLIAGVDRLNDMAQTSTNVIGDLFATTLVAKSEGNKVFDDEVEVSVVDEPVVG